MVIKITPPPENIYNINVDSEAELKKVSQTLDELSDVRISEINGKKNNYVLTYNNSTNTWNAVNPDVIISAAATEPVQPGIPSEFINELHNQIDIDAGLFPNE